MKFKNHEFSQKTRKWLKIEGDTKLGLSIGNSVYFLPNRSWSAIITQSNLMLIFFFMSTFAIAGLMFRRTSEIGTTKALLDSALSCLLLELLLVYGLYLPNSKMLLVLLGALAVFCVWSGALKRFLTNLFVAQKRINWLPTIAVVVMGSVFVFRFIS